MIKRIVKMTFQEEKIEDFIAIFESVQTRIKKVEGCQHLELLRCTEPNNIFFTYSYWDDEAALNKYRHSDLFRSTWSKTKLLFADKPEAWSTMTV